VGRHLKILLGAPDDPEDTAGQGKFSQYVTEARAAWPDDE
jgi:hypothetical protein